MTIFLTIIIQVQNCLKDYEQNPRRISKKDFEKLVESIKQDGYHQPMLIDFDNVIISGDKRKKALLVMV